MPRMAVNKTMEDLAKLAGVSKITVSRALRGSPLVTEETREKVRQIAEAHGGTLVLENRRGHRGCIARLRLPLSAA